MTTTSTYSLRATKAEFRANSYETGDQLVPHVTGLANGGFVVAYHSGTLTTGPVRVDFYNADHQLVGTARMPFEGPIVAVGQPQVIQLKDGNVLVAWADAAEGLMGHLYSQDGLTIGDEIGFGVAETDDIQLAALADGGFALTTTASGDVFQARYDANGSVRSVLSQVNPLAGAQIDSSVAALSGGGYVVTYTDTNPADQTTRAAIYNADGTVKTKDFVVDDFGDNTKSSVVGLKNGGFAVVYKDTGWGA